MARAAPDRIHAPARKYIARRLAEGKTRREALRALKRQLSRSIYRILTGARALAGLDTHAPRI